MIHGLPLTHSGWKNYTKLEAIAPPQSQNTICIHLHHLEMPHFAGKHPSILFILIVSIIISAMSAQYPILPVTSVKISVCSSKRNDSFSLDFYLIHDYVFTEWAFTRLRLAGPSCCCSQIFGWFCFTSCHMGKAVLSFPQFQDLEPDQAVPKSVCHWMSFVERKRVIQGAWLWLGGRQRPQYLLQNSRFCFPLTCLGSMLVFGWATSIIFVDLLDSARHPHALKDACEVELFSEALLPCQLLLAFVKRNANCTTRRCTSMCAASQCTCLAVPAALSRKAQSAYAFK